MADAYLFTREHYAQSINELDDSLKLFPDDPLIYANMGFSGTSNWAIGLKAFKYIRGEHEAVDQSAILLGRKGRTHFLTLGRDGQLH